MAITCRKLRGGRYRELTDVDLQDLIFESSSPVKTFESARFLGDVEGRVEELFYASAFRDWDAGVEGDLDHLRAFCCYC